MQKKIISWGLLVIWAAVIFFFSAQPANQSNQLSTGVTEMIVEVIESLFLSEVSTASRSELVIQLNNIVRKCAHAGVYLVLGVLSVNAFIATWPPKDSQDTKGKLKVFFMALSFCVLYAISDEIHQFFVPGRGCQLLDVLIDTTGAIMGTVLMISFQFRR